MNIKLMKMFVILNNMQYVQEVLRVILLECFFNKNFEHNPDQSMSHVPVMGGVTPQFARVIFVLFFNSAHEQCS